MNDLERKIYNGEHLSERELEDAVMELEEVTTEYGENRRWSRSASTIIKINDKLFCIDWEQGLTESQESYFHDQPYEVEEKTIVTTTKVYVRKK